MRRSSGDSGAGKAGFGGGEGLLGTAARRTREFLSRDLWSPDVAGFGLLRRAVYRCSRVLVLAVRGFRQHRCPFHASALTYITILSIVPLLAFVFSVAKGMGAYERLHFGVIEPFLEQNFGPESGEVGARLRGVLDQVLEFVANTDVGSLGAFGLAILLYTVVKLLGNIESSFNEIWGIRRSRTLARKVTDYVAMIVVVPILLTTAATITAAIQDPELPQRLGLEVDVGPALRVLVLVSPLVAAWTAFSFLYFSMPNARTRVSSTLFAGLAAAVAWQVVQVLHVRFQIGVAKYNQIYAGFAAIPLLMIWIYASWTVVLMGAELAAAHQHEPTLRGTGRIGQRDQVWHEQLGLRVAVRVAEAFLKGGEPLRLLPLARALGVSASQLEDVLKRLEAGGVLARAGVGPRARYLPARDLDSISVSDVLVAVRGRTEPEDFPARTPGDERADRTLMRIEREILASPTNCSLRELATARAVPRPDRD